MTMKAAPHATPLNKTLSSLRIDPIANAPLRFAPVSVFRG